jgi:hypothetical protein
MCREGRSWHRGEGISLICLQENSNNWIYNYRVVSRYFIMSILLYLNVCTILKFLCAYIYVR